MNAHAFLSYAHADGAALERLHKHLAVLKRAGAITTWSDHNILAGGAVDGAISAELDRSGIFIALLSPDYLASSYCYEKEFALAQELCAAGKMIIVPVIVEPCDWLSSPFKQFKALPKDGHPVSSFTNANTAYLDVVTGLRRLIEEPQTGRRDLAGAAGASPPSATRRPRLKQDFDAIQRADYADLAFAAIRNYFRSACAELAQVGDEIRTKFEEMDGNAFTCSVVNRAKRAGGDAHITFHNNKARNTGFGEISYVYDRHAARNTSNGGIRIEHDDYDLFLSMDHFGMQSGRDKTKTTPAQAAEQLWVEFVQRAGIEYE